MPSNPTPPRPATNEPDPDEFVWDESAADMEQCIESVNKLCDEPVIREGK